MPEVALLDAKRVKKFSDFAAEEIPLAGEKVKIDDVVDRPIVVKGARIKKSRYSKNASGSYLILQFSVNGGPVQVLFTGSDVLINQIQKYGDQIPFEATIRKINRYYALT